MIVNKGSSVVVNKGIQGKHHWGSKEITSTLFSEKQKSFWPSDWGLPKQWPFNGFTVEEL